MRNERVVRKPVGDKFIDFRFRDDGTPVIKLSSAVWLCFNLGIGSFTKAKYPFVKREFTNPHQCICIDKDEFDYICERRAAISTDFSYNRSAIDDIRAGFAFFETNLTPETKEVEQVPAPSVTTETPPVKRKWSFGLFRKKPTAEVSTASVTENSLENRVQKLEKLLVTFSNVLKNQNEKITELTAQLSNLAAGVDAHRRFVTTLEPVAKPSVEDPEYMTAAAYCASHEVHDLGQMQRIGKLATSICRTRGILKHNVYHPNYGKIGAYPRNVLLEALVEIKSADTVRQKRA